MTNRTQEVTLMQAALAAQDFDTVRTVAHGMKGAGGSYGFATISALAAAIEAAAKHGQSQTIREELNRLGAYLEHVTVIFEADTSDVSGRSQPSES